MSHIDIQRVHSKPLAEAKKSVDRVAGHLAEKFDMHAEWDGNTLNFSRSGVDGHIQVQAQTVHVIVNLGFLLMMLKGSVEREITRYLDEEFA